MRWPHLISNNWYQAHRNLSYSWLLRLRQRFVRKGPKNGLPGTDRYWRIVLKKSFWGDDQDFLGTPMRFARGDMRDHIVSHKTTTDLRSGTSEPS